MAEPLVVARDLRRTYRVGHEAVVAVAHADCIVPPSARIALVGRSGSGKSTLLQLLAGIETPTAGTIAWPAFGPRETLRPAHIGVVFQNQSLLAPLTVVENVELPLVLRGSTADDARAAALEMLDHLELGELVDSLPEELSGGQAQRVSFARALVTRPELVLADEPTGQVDSETAERFLTAAIDVMDASDAALVVATHDPRVAERCRIQWRMVHGRLEAAG